MIGTIRKLNNMTQEEVAGRLGVERTTVSMWETGGSKPRADTLIKLAALFKCTIDELLKKDESEKEKED